LAFFVSPGTGRSCATAGGLGTGQAIGVYTCADGQCVDAIEADVGADGPARIHRSTGSGALGTKGGEAAAYVTPDWTGRTASIIKNNNMNAPTEVFQWQAVVYSALQ